MLGLLAAIPLSKFCEKIHEPQNSFLRLQLVDPERWYKRLRERALMIMRAILVALAAAASSIIPASAEITDHSANYYLPGCWDFAEKRFGNNPFLQGECIGILEGLAVTASELDPSLVASRSCTPDDVTLAQMASVVVHWFDQHPERWHEDFRTNVLLALHDAWPCPTTR
jgi:hypothetical protein